MTPASLLDQLMQPASPDRGDDLRAFLKAWGAGAPASPSAFERLVEVALRADGRLKAGSAGHQAAIRRLFPDTPLKDITAFCVSEDQGPKPSGILSTLTPKGDGFVLNGRKRWGSMSPLADVLYIAASIGQKDGRNQLRMIKVATDSPGLTLDSTPYGAYEHHMPIADLILTDIEVQASDVIEADAYEAYIKPFRLIEDVYNTAGTQIGLLTLGRVHGWPQELLEDLLGLILQAYMISQTPMARPADVLLMSAYFRASSALWDRLGEAWALVPEAERTAWSPKTGTLGVAARARETRRQQAWASFQIA